MNRVVAVLIGIWTLPIFLLSVLLIRISLGKPVIFKQERPGLLGKPFELYKLRTMRNTVDNEGNLLPDAARLNGLGRFLRKLSLDELPQLLNIIKGDMNFLGPRPLLMEYLPLYNSEQARRHEVKPGITGWAQVNGRNAISWEEKFKLDVWYVDNQSFLLNMKILWFTFTKVIRRDGISYEGKATMGKFLGTEKQQ